MSNVKRRKALSTRSVRAGLESDAQHGSVVPPIYLSSNFAFEAYRKLRDGIDRLVRPEHDVGLTRDRVHHEGAGAHG